MEQIPVYSFSIPLYSAIYKKNIRSNLPNFAAGRTLRLLIYVHAANGFENIVTTIWSRFFGRDDLFVPIYKKSIV